jgi:hypothetical protein
MNGSSRLARWTIPAALTLFAVACNADEAVGTTDAAALRAPDPTEIVGSIAYG